MPTCLPTCPPRALHGLCGRCPAVPRHASSGPARAGCVGNGSVVHRLHSGPHRSRRHQAKCTDRRLGVTSEEWPPDVPAVASVPSEEEEEAEEYGDDAVSSTFPAMDQPAGWQAKLEQKLESMLPKKEDVMCDGDMCDMDWQGSGTIWGAALLIAGSALGGGMLAVPAATSAAGFFPALLCMVGVWLFLLLEGLLIVEVNLAVASWLKRRSASMLAIARVTLGNRLGSVVAGAYLLFSNATLISQIIRGGSIVNEILPSVPYMEGVLAVAALGGSFIYFSSSSGIDRINQALTTVLLGSFALLVVVSLKSAMWAQLLYAAWPEAAHSAPTLLQVLSFCNLIPVVCTYLDMDRERITKAVLLGSSIPLLMVGIWTGISAALVPHMAGNSADPISVLIQGGGGGYVSGLVTVFAGAAVFTTIIGILLSLHEFWQEAFRGKTADTESSKEELEADEQQRPWYDRYGARELKTRVLSLGPALLVATLAPQKAFYDVLSFSGSYLVTFLFGIAPPLMAIVVRGRGMFPGSKWDGPAPTPILPGGLAPIGVLLASTIAFMVLSLSADLPALQEWLGA